MIDAQPTRLHRADSTIVAPPPVIDAERSTITPGDTVTDARSMTADTERGVNDSRSIAEEQGISANASKCDLGFRIPCSVLLRVRISWLPVSVQLHLLCP